MIRDAGWWHMAEATSYRLGHEAYFALALDEFDVLELV